MGIGDWGLGIGDWGLGQYPIPNPQSPIPIFYNYFKNFQKNYKTLLFYNYLIVKINRN